MDSTTNQVTVAKVEETAEPEEAEVPVPEVPVPEVTEKASKKEKKHKEIRCRNRSFSKLFNVSGKTKLFHVGLLL